jgi:PTS system nitrogen regulatory IIA component
MTLDELVPPERVILGLRAADKPALLAALGQRAAAALGVPAAGITAGIAAREALGSTGVGGGIALPHARIDGLPAPAAFLVRLERPIDFAAIDGKPVDLLVLLLSPARGNAEHLSALAALSRRLRDSAAAAALRRAPDAAALRGVLVNHSPP